MPLELLSAMWESRTLTTMLPVGPELLFHFNYFLFNNKHFYLLFFCYRAPHAYWRQRDREKVINHSPRGLIMPQSLLHYSPLRILDMHTICAWHVFQAVGSKTWAMKSAMCDQVTLTTLPLAGPKVSIFITCQLFSNEILTVLSRLLKKKKTLESTMYITSVRSCERNFIQVR